MSKLKHLLERLRGDTDSKSEARASFIKKLILIFGLGELRIHGSAPNEDFALYDYLLDERRVILDLSRLSEKSKQELKAWMFTYYQPYVSSHFQKNYRIKERGGRGYEVISGFWSRVINIFSLKRPYRSLDYPIDLVGDRYQIRHIDFTIAKNTAIVDVVPKLQVVASSKSPTVSEYQDSDRVQDSKRIILTEKNLSAIRKAFQEYQLADYEKLASCAHLHAIGVQNAVVRANDMRQYRKMHGYARINPSFFSQVFSWLKQYFRRRIYKDTHKRAPVYRDYLYLEKAKITIEKDENTQKIRIFEKKPSISTFVFCGGGLRIFGHIGAVKVAMEEYGIKPIHFAGSSCGAIMAACLYIGYKPDDIKKIFKQLKQADFLNFQTTSSAGISSHDSLERKIYEYMHSKLLTYITDYPQCFETGRAKEIGDTLREKGEITFALVKELKSFLPEGIKDEIGESVLVTSTNVTTGEANYFSTDTTPTHNLAQCVAQSACIPVIFHPYEDSDGNKHVDGGVANNLPLNCFRDKSNSFIEHELSADPNVLAFQFDDKGVEEDVIHSERPIFQEGPIANFFYGVTTGIRNPKKGWVAERQERRKYAMQVILMDATGISATDLDAADSDREKMYQKGIEAGRDYLAARNSKYSYDDLIHMLSQDEASLPTGLTHHLIKMILPVKQADTINAELMSKDFENIEELLYYCAYRDRWDIFDELCRELFKKNDEQDVNRLLPVIDQLRAERKGVTAKVNLTESPDLNKSSVAFFKNRKAIKYNQRWYSLLYPLVSSQWTWIIKDAQVESVKEAVDIISSYKETLENHSASQSSFHLLNQLDKNASDPTHLLLYIFRVLLRYSRVETILDENLNQAFQNLLTVVVQNSWTSDIKQPLIGSWSLDFADCCHMLNALVNNEDINALLLSNNRYHSIPLSFHNARF